MSGDKSFTEARKYGIATNMGIYSIAPPVEGGIDKTTASCTNNYTATSEGMRHAIASGFIGSFNIASGSVASGVIAWSNPLIKSGGIGRWQIGGDLRGSGLLISGCARVGW